MPVAPSRWTETLKKQEKETGIKGIRVRIASTWATHSQYTIFYRMHLKQKSIWTSWIDEKSTKISSEGEQMSQLAEWICCRHHRSEIFKGLGKVRTSEAESYGIMWNYQDNIATDVPIPLAPLVLLDWRLLVIAVTLLKSNLCNTDVVSSGLLKRKRTLFEIWCKIFIVCNSQKVISESVSDLIVHGTIQLHDHTYLSKWDTSHTIFIQWNDTISIHDIGSSR